MDEQLSLKDSNFKLRGVITNSLKKADPATRKKVDEIAKAQPNNPDEKAVSDNLQRRKQALIDAGVWSYAP
jgi:hypothetical protein